MNALAGRWIRYANGRWDFKLDMSRFGRCINCKSIGGVQELQREINNAFRVDIRKVFTELSTYLAEDAVAQPNGDCTLPLQIGTGAEYRTFRSLHKTDPSVNIFVTLQEIRGDRLEILRPPLGKPCGNQWNNTTDFGDVSGVDVHHVTHGCTLVLNESVDSVYDTTLPPYCESSDSANKRHCIFNDLNHLGSQEDLLYNACVPDSEGDDETEDAYSDEEDYDYDFWTDFVRTYKGGEDWLNSKNKKTHISV